MKLPSSTVGMIMLGSVNRFMERVLLHSKFHWERYEIKFWETKTKRKFNWNFSKKNDNYDYKFDSFRQQTKGVKCLKTNSNFFYFLFWIRHQINSMFVFPLLFRLYPKLLVDLIPNLGLVVDLTNTKKYYHPDVSMRCCLFCRQCGRRFAYICAESESFFRFNVCLQEFEKLGVAYQKIQVEGHVVPKNLYSKMSVAMF